MTGSGPAEFELMASRLFPLAIEILEKTGSFYPQGVFINGQGQLEFYAVYPRDKAERDEVFDALLKAFQRDAQAKGYRATGISADGRASRPEGGPKMDAILVFLELHTGEAVTYVMQYRTAPDGTYEFGRTFGVRRPAEVFTSS